MRRWRARTAMDTSLHLADVLQQLMRRPNYRYTAGLVSKLSGIPRATIENWLDGQVRKPRRWQDLVKVADTLRLSVAETTHLLHVAGYPPIERLLAQTAHADDRALLAAWTTADVPVPTIVKTAGSAHLPIPPDSFVGREAELATLRVLLRNPNVRVVTLTGTGGSGKTRLALHLAAGATELFAHGIRFVSLAPIRDPSLVAAAIGQALGVVETDGQALIACLQEELRDKQMLLVLDNFEHVAAAALLLAELLAAAPRLKVLITSRLALRLHGEHVFPVPPLALVRPRYAGRHRTAFGADQVVELERVPAIALFVQRAQAANPDVRLTSDNAWDVVTLCARLDGLPLAIELAAARSTVLDPRALLARLEAAHGGTFLQLLARGTRDAPVRQQALHTTLSWSYNLLDPAAQRLFRRLAVFADGDLAAIEAVCGNLGVAVRERGSRLDELLPGSHQLQTGSDVAILDGLATLLDHSLLMAQSETGGTRRFVMLETIREYARDRLEVDGELEVMRQRHAAYYLTLAETAASELQGPHQAEWLAGLEANHANLCGALEWLAIVDATSGLRLATALQGFWWVRCCLTEGRMWLERLLAQVAEPSVLRAAALSGTGLLAYRQGDYAASQEFHTESLAIWRRVDQQSGIATALDALGHVAIHRGDYVLAQSLFEESLELSQQLNDPRMIASAYRALGLAAAHRCDYERAVPLYTQSLATSRAIDDQHGIAITLSNLGDVLRCRQQYTHAAQHYAESLPLFRALGDRHGIAWGLHNLGHIALAEGDAFKAAALFKESLVLCRDLGAKVGIAYGLAGMAGVAVMRGQLPRAACLLGAVEALLTAIRGRMNAADRVAYMRNVDMVRMALDRSTLEAAWQQGWAYTVEQAIGEALDDRRIHKGDTNGMVERATNLERPG
jgi:predicted ATPase